jgi:hypothetical protein
LAAVFLFIFSDSLRCHATSLYSLANKVEHLTSVDLFVFAFRERQVPRLTANAIDAARDTEVPGDCTFAAEQDVHVISTVDVGKYGKSRHSHGALKNVDGQSDLLDGPPGVVSFR